ncbi:MAG: PilT/PilU family type 4a pilus ATPase [Chloroflexi bacterium]|nr:PilT/PilU family type 4a pilus ATPase [Chloroflexota bacterium]
MAKFKRDSNDGSMTPEERVKEVTKKVEDLKSALGMAMADARLAQEKASEAKENMEEALGTIEELQEFRTGFEQRFNEELGAIRKLAEQSEKLSASVGGVNSQLKELSDKTAEIGAVKKSQEEGKALLEEVGKKISVLETKIAGTSDEARKLSESVERELKTEIKKINTFIEQTGSRLNSAEKSLSEISKSTSEKGEELIKKLETALEGTEGALSRSRDALKKVEELESKLSDTSKKYGDLLKGVSDGAKKVEDSLEKITIATRLASQLDDKVKSLTGTMTGLEMGESSIEAPCSENLEFDLNDLLRVMIKHGASDLHIKEGTPPTVRLDGELVPVGEKILSADDCKQLIFTLLSIEKRRLLMNGHELDLAYALPEARFRVNTFLTRGTVSAAFRMLVQDIPNFEELNLPKVLERLASYPNGLVLVTGPAGAGKSTTLASMINYINNTRKLHIITIEDPIEFTHVDKLSIVTQREIGNDSESFPKALKMALREDPNVILIGEMRDPETIMTAIQAAETGHLVLSTLHTTNTVQAIDRILETFKGDAQKQIQVLLASTLRGIVSQRLLTRADGEGRVPAVEVLLSSPTVASLIQTGETSEIYQYLVQGVSEGMQTFTTSLTRLYQAGLITKEEALFHADQPTEFRLTVEGHTAGGTNISEDSLMSWL